MLPVLDRDGGGRMFPAWGNELSLMVSSSNNSAALPINAGLEFCGNDILSGDDAVGRLSPDASRNGFRDTGRGGASSGDN